MPEVVLDASALIALLWREPGEQHVAEVVGSSVMSTVNLSEVLQRFAADGVPVRQPITQLTGLGIRAEPFTVEDAGGAAALREPTRQAGLSLADRACLALARRLDLPVHTADQAWATVDAGVTVVLIR